VRFAVPLAQLNISALQGHAFVNTFIRGTHALRIAAAACGSVWLGECCECDFDLRIPADLSALNRLREMWGRNDRQEMSCTSEESWICISWIRSRGVQITQLHLDCISGIQLESPLNCLLYHSALFLIGPYAF
jgi:hypothetical protein